MPISSKPVQCCIHMSRVFFFFWLGCCPLLYVCTSYVSRDPVSYIVSAYLVSYCLLVRQQQRFHHPTLKPTSTCPSAASVYTAVYMCRVSFFFFDWDVALYCTYVPRVCRVIPCALLLVRTWYRTVFSCDNNSVFTTLHSKQHRFFWWDV